MSDYSSLRKKKDNRTVLAAVSLLLCVALSTSMLFSRLAGWLPADRQHYIPLTVGNGITSVVTGQRAADGGIRFGAPKAGPVVLAASPFLTQSWFETYDENTVWKGETDIEIFRVSYKNGEGQTTVNSMDGDKLLAPGTENTYSFTLENTGSNPVAYEMSMEAYFSDGEKVIPVVARVSDHKGRYLCGSETSYEDVLELNKVKDSGTMKPGYVMPYTLSWEWPFEVDDEYDTWLGNMAVEEDITLTIVIHTLASYTPNGDDGIPKTGDTSGIGLAFGAMVASMAGLLILLLIPRRRREEEHG